MTVRGSLLVQAGIRMICFVVFLGQALGSWTVPREIWVLAGLFLAVSMVRRLFPNRLESYGADKQFDLAQGEVPKEVQRQWKKEAWRSGLVWVVCNAVCLFFLLSLPQREEALWALTFFYSVCDVVCIVAFCPFQVFWMKNRCCMTCVIYNWDYLMMATPLLFSRFWGGRCLFLLGCVVFFQWEWKKRRYPARFWEKTNPRLSCGNCTEKSCRSRNVVLRTLTAFTQQKIEK